MPKQKKSIVIKVKPKTKKVKMPKKVASQDTYRIAPSAMTRVTRNVGPKFVSTSKGIRVTNREMIDSILMGQSASFADNIWSYAVNPGATTFNWLRNLGLNWESYTFKKLEFEYVPACPSTTPGTIVMAFDYDIWDEPPSDHVAMSSWAHASRSTVWTSCTNRLAPSDASVLGKKRFVRWFAEESNRNMQDYDIATFYLAVVSNVTALTVLGELWVTYDVELNTPCSHPVVELNPSGFGGETVRVSLGAKSLNPQSTAENVGLVSVSNTNEVQGAKGSTWNYDIIGNFIDAVGAVAPHIMTTKWLGSQANVPSIYSSPLRMFFSSIEPMLSGINFIDGVPLAKYIFQATARGLVKALVNPFLCKSAWSRLLGNIPWTGTRGNWGADEEEDQRIEVVGVAGVTHFRPELTNPVNGKKKLGDLADTYLQDASSAQNSFNYELTYESLHPELSDHETRNAVWHEIESPHAEWSGEVEPGDLIVPWVYLGLAEGTSTALLTQNIAMGFEANVYADIMGPTNRVLDIQFSAPETPAGKPSLYEPDYWDGVITLKDGVYRNEAHHNMRMNTTMQREAERTALALTLKRKQRK